MCLVKSKTITLQSSPAFKDKIYLSTLSCVPPPPRQIQDRLIYLDVADDFLAKARRFYPPRDSDEEEEGTGLSINLPLLLARVEAGMKRAADGDDEDDEESEREC